MLFRAISVMVSEGKKLITRKQMKRTKDLIYKRMAVKAVFIALQKRIYGYQRRILN
jgi:hypothetical protein